MPYSTLSDIKDFWNKDELGQMSLGSNFDQKPFNISTIARSSDTVTVTLDRAMAWAVGDTIRIEMEEDAEYNTKHDIVSVPNNTSLTFTLTGSDLGSRASVGRVYLDLDKSVVEAKITEADVYIDSRLGKTYDTPIVDGDSNTPDKIKYLSMQLAVYLLWKSSDTGEDEMPEKIKRLIGSYEGAINRLVSGKDTLVNTSRKSSKFRFKGNTDSDLDTFTDNVIHRQMP